MKKDSSSSYQFKRVRKLINIILISVFVLYFAFVGVSALKNGFDEINFSGLDVRTNIKSDVFVDDVKIATTEEKQDFLYTKINPGNHRVKIINSKDNNLKYDRQLIFEKGTTVTFDINFSATNETSSMIIKYFIKKSDDKSKIRIITLTDNSQIKIDGVENKEGIIDSDNKEHDIEVSKDGYLTKILKLNINDKSNNQIGDFDLVVEVKLFQIPFK